MKTSAITPDSSLSERRFYTGISFAILASVLLGFAQSFFLKPLFSVPAPAENIFYVHGAAFTLWILLFVTQVVLIGQGNSSLHKKIGPFAGILVVVMWVMGVFGALTAAARSTGFIGIPIPPLQFLSVPLFDMIVFPICVSMAFIQRHKYQYHKRWMLIATVNIITAAIARWPVVSGLGPLAYFGITDLFIVALAVWDYRSQGRLHPVTLAGGLITIASQPVRLVIAGTAAWISFAEWATSLVR